MIICLDTETTGLYPGNICQLTYIMMESGKVVPKNMFFKVDHVEYGAYAVHGFSVEKLKELSGGKIFRDRIDEIEEDFNRADVLIAHNTAFDFMFLRAEFENVNKVFTFKNEFCTMKKMTPVCKLTRSNHVGYKYPKLNELCAHFDITDEVIEEEVKNLFSVDLNFHDARFDTTALYLAVKCGIKSESAMKVLEEYL